MDKIKIGIIKEREINEDRVALTPDSVKTLVSQGYEVAIEQNAGFEAGFLDNQYIKNGAKISNIPLEILADSDIILKVKPSPATEEISEKAFAKEGSLIIGFFSPMENSELIKYYAKKKVSIIALEQIPRITKAQNFDALSSQASIAGYRCAIEGAYYYNKAMPLMMTAAGTIRQAKVLVLGAGVAGLQAIATAKRLGSTVAAYDVRAATKEQVESLGAKFIHPDINKDFSSKTGYAKELDKEFELLQNEMLETEIPKYDIIISTAAIPGKIAPKLITKNMVENMNNGSVIVDMAASSGGNCELTELDKIIKKNGVTIIGKKNLIQGVCSSASTLLAKNFVNLINYIFKDGRNFDINDEIIKSTLLTHNGEILFK